MSRWKSVLTDGGAALLASAAGNTLRIKRAECGSGSVPENDLERQTVVSGFEKVLSITEVSSSGNVSKIRLQLSNSGVANSFELRQIGIYGAIGNGADVLYMLLQNDEPDVIPSAAQSPNYVYDCLVNLIIGGTESVTAEVDTAAFATVVHSHTPEEVGAAAAGHVHAAGDITSETLGITRGGTGQTSVSGIKTALSISKISDDSVDAAVLKQNGQSVMAFIGYLEQNDNLNDITNTGIYAPKSALYPSTSLNYPVSDNSLGFLEVITSYAILQRYTSISTNIIPVSPSVYVRTCHISGAAFTAWKKVSLA